MIRPVTMLFPEGKRKAFTLSYDDGTIFDKRLIEIMDKYNVKGTFNLNSQRMFNALNEETKETKTEIIKPSEVKEVYIDHGHEVAVHTADHPAMNKIPAASAVYNVIKDRDNLENMIGSIVRGMAYPNGTPCVNDEVLELMKYTGITYSRGTNATHSFKVPFDNFLLYEPTCHHSHSGLFELAEDFANSDKGEPKLFYVWGHSIEFDNQNNWDRMEKLFDIVANRDDVWYATNIEIFDYINAYKQLQFSADMKIVYNPTATDVWFSYDRKPEGILVRAGETTVGTLSRYEEDNMNN